MATKFWLLVYFHFFIAFAQQSNLLHPCPNACSSHGRCDSPSRVCLCFDGYTGGDCSQRLCPSDIAWVDVAIDTDNAHKVTECSNMGICDRDSGVCKCREGFEGIACERQTCPDRCSSVGECLSLKSFANSKDRGEGVVYSYSKPWDANKIYGCKCDEGYSGIGCTLRTCPTGDDPLTGTVEISTSNPLQVNEVQRITCRADGGSFALSLRGKSSPDIPFNAKPAVVQKLIESIPTVGGAGTTKVVFSGHPQACSENGQSSFTVEFLQSFGDIPMLVPDTTKLQLSLSLVSVSLAVAEVIKGTKENLACSGRGVCDFASGVCNCEPDFDTSNGYNAAGLRGDCGYTTAQRVSVCPGLLACSAHGRCSGPPKYVCECSNDWTGADCSERVCPLGPSWVAFPNTDDNNLHDQMAECSNAGDCDRSSGLCDCRTGFTGAACDRLDCSRGIAEDGTSSTCSNHGRCLDMASLAILRTNNGDKAFVTYGDIPNDPFTWDKDRIYGCYCDEGYEGFDCSLKTCPVGPDPLVSGDDEQQILYCTDTDKSGSVVLSFRQQSTAALSASATVDEVKAALEGLSTVGRVLVQVHQPSGNNSLCDVGGSEFMITFKTVHGSLPKITANTINIDSFTVTEYRKGMKEDITCSGRGLCNTENGLCECFAGFGSSDGDTGPGTRRDCGYVLPILPPEQLAAVVPSEN